MVEGAEESVDEWGGAIKNKMETCTYDTDTRRLVFVTVKYESRRRLLSRGRQRRGHRENESPSAANVELSLPPHYPVTRTW